MEREAMRGSILAICAALAACAQTPEEAARAEAEEYELNRLARDIYCRRADQIDAGLG